MASAIRAAFDAAAFVARALRPRGLKGPRVPSRPLPRVPRTPRIAFAALALGVAATGVKEARAHTQEVESILAKTPALDERRSQLFHSMGQNGLISYSDYLFLLCILTKPLAGFQIAFNMLDADGNQHIDKTEFLMMQEIFNSRNERRAEAGAEECATMPAASVKRHGDTTLLVHLFGRNGDKELDYQDFYRFTTALQEEVVWREFQACAHGRRVISEGAFARVLLRYTDVRDAAAITENLAARVPAGQGISFEEFHSFFQFLNNLEDFSIAVQMYTRAGLAIGQDEFRRAVRVATGLHLSPHLVCTVFHLFDEDGDGRLSHTEFLGVMRDRLRRGARDHRTSPKKDDYRTCVRRELSR
ncbi:calcium uptake protein 3, mitochondrial isoform X2 [Lethenteron reissneri]|uniref:calcium uptake protein 3, mitochondrial isoform X2 n=1 Tax=Lethenteron reissneri TaxID=7753 RepID=UPI002AB6F80D|nr:calcium uptake protein 3, mitochondrial isoform X2 [Lethenteron reissneri]